MSTTFTVTRAYRVPNSDSVLVEALAPDGTPLRAELWWSAVSGLTTAQRRAAVGQALAAVLSAQTLQDLGVTGAVSG